MSKLLKKNVSDDLKRRLGGLESYLLVDFRGIDSTQTYDLRRMLNSVGVRMNVVPNRMAVRVLDRWEGKRDDFRSFFRGPTAILHGEGGALAASRVAMQWKKKNKNLLPIKGAVLDGEILPSEAAEGLSKIPDRPQLLAQVAVCFNSPLVRLATVTQGPLANLARVLEAHRKKVEEALPPPAAVASPSGPAEGAQAEPVKAAEAEPMKIAEAEPVNAAQAEPVKTAEAEPVKIQGGESAAAAGGGA